MELLCGKYRLDRSRVHPLMAEVGRPPMAYLSWWRLSFAATLLRDTQDMLAALARRVGYGSPYALSHAFSREFGTTPVRYRAQLPAGH